jgi:hypothetical protein
METFNGRGGGATGRVHVIRTRPFRCPNGFTLPNNKRKIVTTKTKYKEIFYFLIYIGEN